MKYLLIILLMITVYTVHAQGIKFEENLTWVQIKAKAKAENKYIMMDTYATWCGPCKQMSTETFPKKEVGDFINDKFISVKVQMDQTKGDNEYVKNWYRDAKTIGDVYEVRAYPTVLYFAPNGKMVHSTVGYQDEGRLISEAKVALKNDAEYADKLIQFKKGRLDTAAMKVLLGRARELKDWNAIQQVSDQYISKIAPKDMFTMDNLRFIGQHLSSKSKYYGWFNNNLEKIKAVIGKRLPENYIMAMIYREEIAPYDKAERPDWEAIEKKVVSKYGRLGEERVWGNRMAYSGGVQDWTNFGKYYKKYFDRAIPHERSFIHINNMSWTLFEHISDTTILNVGIKAMEYDIDKNMRYDAQAMDTYANLLYKAGRKDDAIKWEDLARRLSDNGKEFVETLEKMKAGVATWPIEEAKN